jgi:hypothetical protein
MSKDINVTIIIPEGYLDRTKDNWNKVDSEIGENCKRGTRFRILIQPPPYPVAPCIDVLIEAAAFSGQAIAAGIFAKLGAELFSVVKQALEKRVDESFITVKSPGKRAVQQTHVFLKREQEAKEQLAKALEKLLEDKK